MGFCQNIPTRFWASSLLIFWIETFFQVPLENFLWTLRTCSRYLKGLPNLDLCVSKKIMTARHTNRIICQEKWKKLRFWKNEAQNRVGIFWQNPIFWAETFFQSPLEIFLWTLRTCLRYLKGPPNIVLYVSKKIVTARHTNQIIFQEKWKKLRFWKNEAQN